MAVWETADGSFTLLDGDLSTSTPLNPLNANTPPSQKAVLLSAEILQPKHNKVNPSTAWQLTSTPLKAAPTQIIQLTNCLRGLSRRGRCHNSFSNERIRIKTTSLCFRKALENLENNVFHSL